MAKLWWVLLVLLLTGCGSGQEAQEREPEATDPLLIVDGAEIPAWRYFAFLERELSASEDTPDAADRSDLGIENIIDFADNIEAQTLPLVMGKLYKAKATKIPLA